MFLTASLTAPISGKKKKRNNEERSSGTLNTPWNRGGFLNSRITFKAGTKLAHLRLKANEVALINESDLQGRTHQPPGDGVKSSGASDQETDIKEDFRGFNIPRVGDSGPPSDRDEFFKVPF